jgi:hypothetical protein
MLTRIYGTAFAKQKSRRLPGQIEEAGATRVLAASL